jgi:hypothetical protein
MSPWYPLFYILIMFAIAVAIIELFLGPGDGPYDP